MSEATTKSKWLDEWRQRLATARYGTPSDGVRMLNEQIRRESTLDRTVDTTGEAKPEAPAATGVKGWKVSVSEQQISERTGKVYNSEIYHYYLDLADQRILTDELGELVCPSTHGSFHSLTYRIEPVTMSQAEWDALPEFQGP